MSSRRRSFKSLSGAITSRASSAHAHAKRILKIVVKAVAVRATPGKVAAVVCQLNYGIYVQQIDELESDSLTWLHIGCGWICSVDSSGAPTFVVSNEAEAHASWSLEFDVRRKISQAVGALLSRSYGLSDARRLSRSIMNHAKTAAGKKLLNVLDVNVEDLLIGLNSSTGLRQNEILDFIRITASQQSNPPKVVEDIATEIDRLINLRPTLWTTQDLHIIETTETKLKNKKFIMAAARGEMKVLEKCLAEGQDLIALHPEMGYTALHAAADFGRLEIVRVLLNAGVSPNIRDIKKAQTPLHFAAQSGRTEICLLLLEKGADRTLPNTDGQLPYQIANDFGYIECREILKQCPPEIHHISVTETTSRSLSITWQPPVMSEGIYARIIDYVVEWTPIGDPAVVGHGQTFKIAQNSFTLTGLMPYSGHGFRVYSRSLAGLSPPSSRMVPFTTPCEPDPPSPIEIFKVTTNTIQLAWNPPASTNGSPLDFYQLEVVECDQLGFVVGTHDNRTDYTLSEGGVPPVNFDNAADLDANRDAGKTVAGAKRGGRRGSDSAGGYDSEDTDARSSVADDFPGTEYKPPDPIRDKLREFDLESEGGVASRGTAATQPDKGPNSTGGPNRSYRLIKHKSVDHLQRDVTGLRPNSYYKCRIRCHTELGYSYWSDWCAPVMPRAGVYVIQFNDYQDNGGGDPASREVRLGWFQPSLTGTRTVSQYELQQCVVKGPLHKIINVSMPSFLRKREPAEASSLDFVTIREGLTKNEVFVDKLMAGRNYLFRVRPCVGGKWIEWSQAVQSDVVSIPACRPNPPYDVRIATVPEDEDGVAITGPVSNLKAMKKASSDGDWDDEVRQEVTEAESITRKEILDIGHDFLVICWMNGRANGSPVIEYEIQMAQIREYRESDIVDKDNKKRKSKVHKVSPGKAQSELIAKPNPMDESLLEWVNVTKQGDFLGPNAFRVTDLQSGTSYCFRVRQKNKLGWSDFSLSSVVASTWATAPPGKPYLLEIYAKYAVLQWPMRADSFKLVNMGLDLTTIEYEVQIAKLPFQYSSSSPLKSNRPQRDAFEDVPMTSDYLSSPKDGYQPGLYPNLASSVSASRADELFVWAAAETRPHKQDTEAFNSISPSPLVSTIILGDSLESSVADNSSVDDVIEGFEAKVATSNIVEPSLRVALNTHESIDGNSIKQDTVTVLVDRLSASTCYVVRVRARTVAGWSRWSQISDEFRTTDAS